MTLSPPLSPASSLLRRWIQLAGTLLLALLLLPWGSTAAWAHASLLTSDPADGAILTSAPTSGELVFNESIGIADDSLVLYGPDSLREVLEGAPLGDTVGFPMPSDLPEGSYLLDWRITSIDSHPLSGTITFSIGAPGPLPDREAPTDDPLVTVALPIGQFLGFLGMVVAVGAAVLWALTVRRPGRAEPAVRRLVTVAAVVAVLGQLLVAPLDLLRQRGAAASDLLSPGLWGEALTGDGGITVALVAVGLALVVVAVRTGAARLPLLALGSWLALSSAVVVGHTRGPKSDALMVAADLVHVTAASIWTGGLFFVVLRVRALRDDPAGTASTVRTFSRCAVISVLALALSGSWLAFTMLDSWEALLHTGYGQALLIKLGVVVLVLVLAAANRRWIRRLRDLPAPADGLAEPVAVTGVSTFRTVLAVELALLVVVVGVTSVLVRSNPVLSEGDSGAAVAQRDQFDYLLEFDGGSVVGWVRPLGVGFNNFRMTVRDSTDTPIALSAAPTAMLTGAPDTLAVNLFEASTGEYSGDIRIPAAGEWFVVVTLEIDGVEHVVQLDLVVPAA